MVSLDYSTELGVMVQQVVRRADVVFSFMFAVQDETEMKQRRRGESLINVVIQIACTV